MTFWTGLVLAALCVGCYAIPKGIDAAWILWTERRRERRIRLHPELLTTDDFRSIDDRMIWQSMHPSARVVDIRTKAAKQGKHFRAGYTVNR